MILLLAALAWADDAALARGDDREAFAALTADAPVTALLAFLDAYPDSLLAERVWARARVHPDLDAAWVRTHRELVDGLERSLRGHEENLRRVPGPAPVAALSADGDPAPIHVPWIVGATVGASYEAPGAYGVLAARIERGAWSGIARAQLGRATFGELSLRLHPAAWGPVWIAVAADTRARGAATLGVQIPLGGWLRVDAGGGARVGVAGATPILRAEIGGEWSIRQRRRPIR